MKNEVQEHLWLPFAGRFLSVSPGKASLIFLQQLFIPSSSEEEDEGRRYFVISQSIGAVQRFLNKKTNSDFLLGCPLHFAPLGWVRAASWATGWGRDLEMYLRFYNFGSVLWGSALLYGSCSQLPKTECTPSTSVKIPSLSVDVSPLSFFFF